ncbi:uncharacterized protein LOC131539256 isoform X2 [Onychostoma macrolepis]|nr:uncharacterized protein LOC131539256 isoform X2 [Onychostoma macrolepis]
MITYTVVEFEKEKTVAIVCRTWIVANGNVLSCYWPSSEPTKKAKNGELPDKKTWKLFKIRIIEKSFTSNYEKAVKYLRRAEELSNVETDGDTQIKKRAHKRPSRFESDTEDECVTPAKRPRFQCLAGNRPQAPVFTENRQEHEPLPQVTSAMPYQNGCQVTNEEQNYLTLNRKIDEVIRELRQFREIIMQQQQQVVEEQAHVEQMQTEEELSAFCSKLNEERSFRKSMIAFSVRFCSGTVGQSVRRMMRAFGTNMLWSNFSLKGRKGKKVFQDLPIMRLITRACLQTFKAAKMAEIEGEVAECLKHAPHKRGGPKNLRIDVHRAEDDDEEVAFLHATVLSMAVVLNWLCPRPHSQLSQAPLTLAASRSAHFHTTGAKPACKLSNYTCRYSYEEFKKKKKVYFQRADYVILFLGD